MKQIYTIVSLLLPISVCIAGQGARAVRPETGTTQSVVTCSNKSKDLEAIAQLVFNVEQGVQDCCNDLTTDIEHWGSVVDSNLTIVIDALNGISNVDLFTSSFETLFSIIDSFDRSLLASLITTIEGLNSSFDQVTSLIDADIAIDETTFSKVSKIDTQMDAVESSVDLLINQDCASTSDIIATEIDSFASQSDLIVSLIEQSLDLDQTIISLVDKLDTQLDAIESTLDITVQECASRSDIIINDLQSLQEQEAQCCAQLSSDIDALQTDVDSRLDLVQETIDGLSNIAIIESQLSLLISAIEGLDDAIIASLLDITISEFDVVTSQLDNLFPCGSTPISSTTTITVPGHYCVDQDFAGVITIAASDVTLDINSHTIVRVNIQQGFKNIRVSNGYITGGLALGISVSSGCDNISLNNIHVSGGSTGVQAFGAFVNPITNLSITNVTATNCSNSGFFLIGCSGTISNCEASFNVNNGFTVTNQNLLLVFENCQANNNDLAGFETSGISFTGLAQCMFYGCVATQNGTAGFIFNDYSNLYVSGCRASFNGTVNPGDGFYVNNTIDGSVTGLITDSIATQNTRAGFNMLQYSNPGNSVDCDANNSNCFVLRYTGNYAADNQLVLSGKIVNYAINDGTAAANISPYFWVSWKNAGTGRWVNADGNN